MLSLIELLNIQFLTVLEKLDELVIFSLESLNLFIVLLFLLTHLAYHVLQILYFLRCSCHLLARFNLVLKWLFCVLSNETAIVGYVARRVSTGP